MAITAQEIAKVVELEDDFGHEMRVGSLLKPENIQYPNTPHYRSRFSHPIHGATYSDPKTGKARQFDYRSEVKREVMGRGRILFAVECKNLNPDFPLVVCGRPRTTDEAYHAFIGRDRDDNPCAYKVVGRSSIYEPDSFVGKSILRLKIKDKKLCGDGDSEIYDRWSQALASSHDLAFEAGHNMASDCISSFVMPIVVLPNESLWRVEYNDQGKTSSAPEKIDQCEFYVDHQMPIHGMLEDETSLPGVISNKYINVPLVLTHIHFVTCAGLEKILSDYANSDSYKWDKVLGIHTATRLD